MLTRGCEMDPYYGFWWFLYVFVPSKWICTASHTQLEGWSQLLYCTWCNRFCWPFVAFKADWAFVESQESTAEFARHAMFQSILIRRWLALGIWSVIQGYPGQVSFAKLWVVMTFVTEWAFAAFAHGDVSRYFGNGVFLRLVFASLNRNAETYIIYHWYHINSLPYSVMDSSCMFEDHQTSNSTLTKIYCYWHVVIQVNDIIMSQGWNHMQSRCEATNFQIKYVSINKTRLNNSKPFQTYHWKTGNPSSLELAGILPCSTAGDDGFRAQCASLVLNSDMYSSSRLPWDAQEQLDSSDNLMTWIFLNFSISI